MDGNLETTEQQLERGWKVGWETEYPGKVSGTDPTTICRGQGGETEQAGQAGFDLHAPLRSRREETQVARFHHTAHLQILQFSYLLYYLLLLFSSCSFDIS
jgi:hypothetical protein